MSCPIKVNSNTIELTDFYRAFSEKGRKIIRPKSRYWMTKLKKKQSFL